MGPGPSYSGFSSLGRTSSFFEGSQRALPFLGDARLILLPAVGLLIVSAIVRRWAPEARGHGVPEVQYAVRRGGGRIRPRVAAIKALASAICIGSGGSVGREGPIVQIGSTLGSSVGALLGLREDGVKLLVACGAAAGIGGTFNAPIAGVLFAMEVILGTFTARSFGVVVLASVASTALVQSVVGREPAFALQQVFSLVRAPSSFRCILHSEWWRACSRWSTRARSTALSTPSAARPGGPISRRWPGGWAWG